MCYNTLKMNLWTDFDNHHQLEEHAVGRTRRLTEHDVVSSLRHWLLSDYAVPYCRSLAATRIFRRCYWVDALGLDMKANNSLNGTTEESKVDMGKNRKKEVLRVIPPVLQPLVSLAQTLAQESKPITLQGLMLEAGSGRRKEGKAAQNGVTTLPSQSHLPKESGIVHASWLEVASALLTEIDQSPAIFLLRPFGQTLFRHEDLAPLYQRTVPTEILLLVSHKQVATRLLAAHRSVAHATPLTSLLRTDRWKTLSTKEEEIEDGVEGLLDLFVSSMQRSFSLPVQRIRLPVQVRPAVVGMLPYTLLFATKRQDSIVCMNDAFCLYQRRVLEQSHRGVLAEEWFLAQQQQRLAEERAQLYQRTLLLGKAQHIRRWPDLRHKLLLAHFGQYTHGEYDTVMQQLLSNGAVRCERRGGAMQNQEGRVPGNDDTLVWA
jgi:hypothetical protein